LPYAEVNELVEVKAIRLIRRPYGEVFDSLEKVLLRNEISLTKTDKGRGTIQGKASLHSFLGSVAIATKFWKTKECTLVELGGKGWLTFSKGEEIRKLLSKVMEDLQIACGSLEER